MIREFSCKWICTGDVMGTTVIREYVEKMECGSTAPNVHL